MSSSPVQVGPSKFRCSAVAICRRLPCLTVLKSCPAFVIPSGYVTTRFGIDYVQLRKGDETIEVPVQRGRELPTAALPDGLEILSGIRAGDQLVRP